MIRNLQKLPQLKHLAFPFHEAFVYGATNGLLDPQDFYVTHNNGVKACYTKFMNHIMKEVPSLEKLCIMYNRRDYFRLSKATPNGLPLGLVKETIREIPKHYPMLGEMSLFQVPDYSDDTESEGTESEGIDEVIDEVIDNEGSEA